MGCTGDDTGVTGTPLLISTEGLKVALLLKFVPSVGKVSLRIHMGLYHIRIRHSNLYSSGALGFSYSRNYYKNCSELVKAGHLVEANRKSHLICGLL